MRKYLFNVDKYRYVTGERPKADCILCEMIAGNPDIRNLVLCKTEFNLVTLNLYPYNPGHLMIAPLRHIESLAQLNSMEAADSHRLLVFSLNVLEEEFSAHGFNVGYNLGDESGASIAHIHQHIVPRYRNEVGFIDVLAGDRIAVVDPIDQFERLKQHFDSYGE
ncbi:MAG: HIT domain-containing protein [Spirochaetes bacterium]|jgi:ATP adenylyltransferase|nr:HIT domain-containing protein [Spirochaetota bacterium]